MCYREVVTRYLLSQNTTAIYIGQWYDIRSGGDLTTEDIPEGEFANIPLLLTSAMGHPRFTA